MTRRWPLFLLLPVLAFGAFAGGLMTWHHETQAYGGAAGGTLIGCEVSATVNCDLVNTSEWSELLGVPLATFGAATYLALIAITALVLGGRRDLHLVLVVAGAGMVLFSGFLFYVSKVQLGFVCSWCLRMYAANVAVLVLSVLAGRPPAPSPRTLGPAAALTALIFAVVIGGQKLHRRTLGSDAALPKGGPVASSDTGGPLGARSFPVTTEEGTTAPMQLSPGDAWKGNPQARVTLVEFADLECGFCKRASAELKRVVEAYGDRVVLVFKHFPLDNTCNPVAKSRKHPHACDAALAARCAQEQGKFWAFHDLAYKNQHQLERVNLRQYAKQTGLDLAKWDACTAAPQAHLAAIAADAQLAAKVAVHGTPRIWINGTLYRGGSSAEAMARAVDEALGGVGRSASLAVDAGVAAIPADVPAMRALGGFRIDTFEASLDGGVAESGKHRIPATRMSWYAARDACAAAGKRLCTEAEWVTACQGAPAVDDDTDGQFADDMIEGTAYPYGDFFERDRCWDDKQGDAYRPVYTGELPGCVSAGGVYDLTGNVEEWVGDRPETAVLLGGGWDTRDDHARCYRRNDSFGAAYASPRSGFRCCADPAQ